MRRSRRWRAGRQGNGHVDGEAADQDREFDGDEDATPVERRGIDTHALEELVASHRERFDRHLPHPKLNATAESLRSAFDTGEKALVFVRRIRTVEELKRRLDQHFDAWVRRRLEAMLPEHGDRLDQVFEQYDTVQRRARVEDLPTDGLDSKENPNDRFDNQVEEDWGGTDTFFVWFFRGAGPKDVLSGTAFQKNRLSSVSSAYASMCEDEYVGWILGLPADPLAALAEACSMCITDAERWLTRSAHRCYLARTTKKEGYPRLHVFAAYQDAVLRLLYDRAPDPLGARANIILQERFRESLPGEESVPPRGFPRPADVLGKATFFTELQRRPHLRMSLWPEEMGDDFRTLFRRREQRRELLSAVARPGAAFIDLYATAIRGLGSLELRAERTDQPERRLIADFLDFLERQFDEGGFNAFHELSAVASDFDLIVSVNFPEITHMPLDELATHFARTLQHQMPVGGMSGGVNKRLVRQFRVPGFPLVLVTTDVLQEGEDLHTFCRRIIHYGITWTPSGVEQRTGRIDRIGSLVQRRLDGSEAQVEAEDFIQVYYPHLRDTVERLQVRRVLERLNQFLRLIHESGPQLDFRESRLDVSREVLDRDLPVPVIAGELKSRFPVGDAWLNGEQRPSDVHRPDLAVLTNWFAELTYHVRTDFDAQTFRPRHPRHFAERVAVERGEIVPRPRYGRPGVRQQDFELELRAQLAGDATLIRCTSPIGAVELHDSVRIDLLRALQRDLGARVCAVHNHRHKNWRLTAENDRLFRIDATAPEEVIELVRRTVLDADAVEECLLGVDQDWTAPRETDDE